MNYLQRKKLAFMSIVNSVKGFVRTVIGIPPLALPNCVDADSVIDYKIYGNSVQDGTPSPDNPVELVSVGEKTKNLVSGLLDGYANIGDNFGTLYNLQNGVFKTIHLENLKAGSYSFSFEKPVAIIRSVSTNFHNSNVDVSTAPQYNTTCCVVTLTQDEDDFYISFRDVTSSATEWGNAWVQGEEGATATSYEPYGKYKIPIKARGKNLFDKDNFTYTTPNLEESPTVGGYAYTVNGKTGTLNGSSSGEFKINLPSSISPINKKIAISAYITLLEYGDLSHYTRAYLHDNLLGVAHTYVNSTEALELNKRVRVTWIFNDVYSEFDAIRLYINGNKIQVEMDTFQIEEGNTVTEYEPYVEPITTNIYLDKHLRGIADCADYIDFENSKVVRNIEYTGLNEKFSWRTVAAWNTANTYYFDCVNQVHNIKEQPEWETVKALCNMFSAASNTVWGKSDDTVNKFSVNAANKQFRCRVSKDIATTVDEFKNFITNNNIGIAYQMETPKEENIELPTLPTLKGTTIYEVDALVQPSNIEVTYYSTRKGD